MDDRLYRSPTDRVIAGVAGGIAAWAHIDPSIVRVAWVLAAIFSGGIFVLIYFVMMIVVPLAPQGWVAPQGQRATPGADQVPGWGAQPAGWTPGTGGSVGGSAGTGQAPGAQQPTAGWAAPSVSVPDGVALTRGARLASGAVLVVVGLWLLLGSYLDIDWNLLWPLLVMAAGAVLVLAALRHRGR